MNELYEFFDYGIIGKKYKTIKGDIHGKSTTRTGIII